MVHPGKRRLGCMGGVMCEIGLFGACCWATYAFGSEGVRA